MLRPATLLLAVAGALAPTGAGAQAAAEPFEAIDPTVAALVADEWGLSPEEVSLEWGSAGSTWPDPEASVSLVGTGSGGHWVVRLETEEGGSVSYRVRAGHRVERPVAARRIARGQAVSESDVEIRETLVWGPPRPSDDEVQPGWVAQRPIAKGDELVSPAVRAPLLVTSGSPVDVLWESGAVRIRMPARAAGSGALGDRVRVRTDSGKRMTGVVVAPGVVDVTRAAARNTTGGMS